jgi:hypothetical protein
MKVDEMVGKSGGKGELGRPRSRRGDYIRMNIGEIGFEDVNWIHLAQDKD